MRPLPAVSVLLLSACALAACSRDAATAAPPSTIPASAAGGQCLPQVRDGWIRLVPGDDMPMDAGYATIDNPCDVAVVVTAATSKAYADVSLHESTLESGMSRMRPVPELRIAAHGQAMLEPGGLHLMLMAPHARPKVGDRVAIQVRLQDGRRVDGDFDVRAMTP
ncbi:MAG: copper chaperone PCu(A)C [Lysobacter sp.]|nr:copper chaperone PCu(A)C [Lysobacter sp.]